VAARVAPGLELLEVRDLANVDLGGEVAPDRLLQRLACLEVPARERPRAQKRLSGALPQQHLEPAVADLQDDREGDMGRTGRLVHEF
jgi:hypothetical protein